MFTVADGIYRFQNLAAADGFEYLELETTGRVVCTPSDPSSSYQKWKVTKHGDSYQIANVATGELLAVAAPSGGETAYTLNTQGNIPTSWDVEQVSGNKVVLKPAGHFSNQVVDFSQGNRLILWDRNNYPNQTWILEHVDEAPKSTEKVNPQWVPVHGSDFPANAVQGGWDVNKNTEYVARGYFNNDHTYRSGKAGVNVPGICRVVVGKNEQVFSNFDVLVASQDTYQWVPYSPGKILADGAWSENPRRLKPIVVGNSPARWGPIFIIRCVHNGALVVGHAAKTSAWVGFDGVTVSVSNIPGEVLCYT